MHEMVRKDGDALILDIPYLLGGTAKTHVRKFLAKLFGFHA
jgi:hypothetical protein